VALDVAFGDDDCVASADQLIRDIWINTYYIIPFLVG
jgi:hypothetical protein